MLKRDCCLAGTGFALLLAGATLAQAQPAQQMNVGQGMTPAQFGPSGGGRIMSMPAGAGVLQPGLMGGGYSPYFPGDFNQWAGGTLTGAANLVGAQGQLMVSQQQAFLQRENVRSAKIDNKRKAFDEYLYEKEHTPTAEEERQRAQQMYLSRARNSPPSVEIWNGSALNILLQDLRKNVGKADPPSPQFTMTLDPEMLKQINVTSGRGEGNVGILKDGGKLTWPDALSGPEYKDDREQISSLIDDSIKQATFNNRVDPGTVRQLQKDVDSMGRMLRKRVDETDVNSYIDAKQFLANLDSSITIFRQSDVGNYFNGKNTLKSRNVDELVKHMATNGLTFAPAVPGQESAYNALYQAMANYDAALQTTASNK